MKPKEKGDLAVEKHGVLYRVQIKYAGFYSGIRKHKAALRTMGGNQSYHTARKYSDEDFDLLFIYAANTRMFLIPWKELTNRNSISIESSKFLKYEVQ